MSLQLLLITFFFSLQIILYSRGFNVLAYVVWAKAWVAKIWEFPVAPLPRKKLETIYKFNQTLAQVKISRWFFLRWWQLKFWTIFFPEMDSI